MFSRLEHIFPNSGLMEHFLNFRFYTKPPTSKKHTFGIMLNYVKPCFIVKGNSKSLNKILSRIKQFAGSDSLILITKRQGHANELFIEAQKAKCSHIFAVGGDGTVNELVNSFIKHSNKENRPILAIIPAGSGNDFCRVNNITWPNQLNFNNIIHSTPTLVDVGMINFTGCSGENSVRYFLNVADIGIGGCVAEMLGNDKNKLTYMLATLKAFYKFNPSEITLKTNNKSITCRTMAAIFANSKSFADGLYIAPDAIINDGKLNLVHLKNISVFDYLKNLGKLRNGTKLKHKEIDYSEIEYCKISHSTDKMAIDCDGEFIGYTPAKFSILKGEIRVLMNY